MSLEPPYTETSSYTTYVKVSYLVRDYESLLQYMVQMKSSVVLPIASPLLITYH